MIPESIEVCADESPRICPRIFKNCENQCCIELMTWARKFCQSVLVASQIEHLWNIFNRMLQSLLKTCEISIISCKYPLVNRSISIVFNFAFSLCYSWESQQPSLNFQPTLYITKIRLESKSTGNVKAFLRVFLLISTTIAMAGIIAQIERMKPIALKSRRRGRLRSQWTCRLWLIVAFRRNILATHQVSILTTISVTTALKI